MPKNSLETPLRRCCESPHAVWRIESHEESSALRTDANRCPHVSLGMVLGKIEVAMFC
jgi:hypothetical protein